MRALILAEDFVKDEFLLQPIIQAMMKALGKSNSKVKVCKDPRFHGTGEALKWESIKQALDRHRGMVDLFLLCVDRDGEKNRRDRLDGIEKNASGVVGENRCFLAENAWQEVEVWLLMGHDLPPKWNWKKIRAEVHPKETYFQPFAKSRGVLDLPGEGRDKLAREAATRYDRIRSRCKEDVQRLENRIREWIEKQP
ncbi:MAG: hypothetical protein ACP5XB_00010 [Isosphaeraceae bacterium]